MTESTKLDFIKNTNICSLVQLIIDNSHQAEAAIIANVTRKAIEKNGGSVSKDNLKILKTMAMVLLTDLKRPDTVVVVPGECGLGKSTLIEEYLKYKLSTDPDFGAIVVKEKITDIISLEIALGDKARGLYSFNSEECLKQLPKYSRKECRACGLECKMKEARTDQKNYPVVIMSSEKLRMTMLYHKDLREFEHYYDSNGRIKDRFILIIDEKPPIAINKEISRREIHSVDEVLKGAKEDSKLFAEVTAIHQKLEELNQAMASLDKRSHFFDAIDPKFQISKELKSYFFNAYKGNDPEIMELIAGIIRKGGVIRQDNLNKDIEGKIFTVDHIDYSGKLKTVIFDATALYDIEYKGNTFSILSLPTIREYPKLDIYNCPVNLSRSTIRKKEKPIEPNALFQDLSFINGKEVLILTYKAEEKLLAEAVSLSGFDISNTHVYFDHFNNVKGKNDYSEAEILVMYGVNFKSDDFYLAKAYSLGMNISNTDDYINTANGRLSTNQEIRKLTFSDMFTDLLQSIFRTKLRRNQPVPVQVYFFNPYLDVVDMLNQYLLNSRCNQWFPENFYRHYLDNELKHDQKILELVNFIVSYFTQDSKGDTKLSIRKRELREALGYKNLGTFADHLNSNFVKYKLKQLDVKVGYRTLEKSKQFNVPREEMVV